MHNNDFKIDPSHTKNIGENDVGVGVGVGVGLDVGNESFGHFMSNLFLLILHVPALIQFMATTHPGDALHCLISTETALVW